MDTIDDVEIDVDSVDADGETPQCTICTLHLHGDFQDTIENWHDEAANKLVFLLHRGVAEKLHKELGKVLYG